MSLHSPLGDPSVRQHTQGDNYVVCVARYAFFRPPTAFGPVHGGSRGVTRAKTPGKIIIGYATRLSARQVQQRHAHAPSRRRGAHARHDVSLWAAGTRHSCAPAKCSPRPWSPHGRGVPKSSIGCDRSQQSPLRSARAAPCTALRCQPELHSPNPFAGADCLCSGRVLGVLQDEDLCSAWLRARVALLHGALKLAV